MGLGLELGLGLGDADGEAAAAGDLEALIASLDAYFDLSRTVTLYTTHDGTTPTADTGNIGTVIGEQMNQEDLGRFVDAATSYPVYNATDKTAVFQTVGDVLNAASAVGAAVFVNPAMVAADAYAFVCRFKCVTAGDGDNSIFIRSESSNRVTIRRLSAAGANVTFRFIHDTATTDITKDFVVAEGAWATFAAVYDGTTLTTWVNTATPTEDTAANLNTIGVGTLTIAQGVGTTFVYGLNALGFGLTVGATTIDDMQALVDELLAR